MSARRRAASPNPRRRASTSAARTPRPGPVASRPRSPRGLPARAASDAPAEPVRCMICGCTTMIPGLDLGHQPVSDALLSEADLNRPETTYPLQLFHCPDCGLAQLGYTVDPAIIYDDFPFLSGTTRTATRHLQALATSLAERFGLAAQHLALDIGSNDGTLLAGYADCGARVLGVDPAGNAVKVAKKNGIPTMHAFFNVESAERILAEHGKAKVITSAGTFAHIADLDGVMRGVKTLLARGGVFVTDNQYWADMVRHLHYDNVFHEHLRHYGLRPYQRLMATYGLEVFDVDRSDMFGGSVCFYAARKGNFEVTDRVRALEAEEAKAKLYEPKTIARFNKRVDAKRVKLFDAVYTRVRDGQRVVGLGAPAKATTVLNYCGLDHRLVEYVTEINALRIGKWMPGVHIPILDERLMFEEKRPPDAGILFAWNYAKEIVPKLREKGWHGEVLLP